MGIIKKVFGGGSTVAQPAPLPPVPAPVLQPVEDEPIPPDPEEQKVSARKKQAKKFYKEEEEGTGGRSSTIMTRYN